MWPSCTTVRLYCCFKNSISLCLVTCSAFTGVLLFFWQAIFNAQKTSVPGDLITVPGATEKISFICMLAIFIQTFIVFIYLTDFKLLHFHVWSHNLGIWKPVAPGSISRHQRVEIEGRTINRSLMCVAGIAYWVAGMESNYIDECFPIGMYTSFFFPMFSESNNFGLICVFAFEHVGQSRNEM